jgi:hypothetical protein
MRSWTVWVACTMASCVVYRQGDDWSESSTWSSSTSGPREGEVEVSWQVGPSSCEEAAVETVEVELGGTVRTFPCTDEGATVTAPEGRHDLVLRGLDAEGIARYEGEGGRVRVHPGQTNSVPTVILSALPASIAATWFFENGHLCSQNGVDQIEVTLFDAGDAIEHSEMVPCEQGAIEFMELEAGRYALLLLGRDGEGNVHHAGTSQLEAGRGDHLSVEIMLTPEG